MAVLKQEMSLNLKNSKKVSFYLNAMMMTSRLIYFNEPNTLKS